LLPPVDVAPAEVAPVVPPFEVVSPPLEVPPFAWAVSPALPEDPPFSVSVLPPATPADPAEAFGGTVQVPLMQRASAEQSVWRMQLPALAHPLPSTQTSKHDMDKRKL
jgi:hypothetical protein